MGREIMAGLKFLGRAVSVCRVAALLSLTGGAIDGSAVGRFGLADPAMAAKIVIQRTTIYISTLPKGCVKTIYGNYVVWKCGKTYYQSYNGKYVVVYIKTG
jgi:hypothetical protein